MTLNELNSLTISGHPPLIVDSNDNIVVFDKDYNWIYGNGKQFDSKTILDGDIELEHSPYKGLYTYKSGDTFIILYPVYVIKATAPNLVIKRALT